MGHRSFAEAVAKEVAPFGITLTLVEPGPTGTNFGAGLVRPEPMDTYQDTPVGAVRRAIADGSFKITGDAEKTVGAMIAVAEEADPPLRLTLGSTAFASIHAALTERREALEAQKGIALSTDVTASP